MTEIEITFRSARLTLEPVNIDDETTNPHFEPVYQPVDALVAALQAVGATGAHHSPGVAQALDDLRAALLADPLSSP